MKWRRVTFIDGDGSEIDVFDGLRVLVEFPVDILQPPGAGISAVEFLLHLRVEEE